MGAHILWGGVCVLDGEMVLNTVVTYTIRTSKTCVDFQGRWGPLGDHVLIGSIPSSKDLRGVCPCQVMATNLTKEYSLVKFKGSKGPVHY
jgi:hypothetical protein